MEKLHAVTASEQVLHYEHGWTRVFLRRVAWGGGGGLRRVGKRFAGSLALLQTTHWLVLFKLHNFYAGAETILPKR